MELGTLLQAELCEVIRERQRHKWRIVQPAKEAFLGDHTIQFDLYLENEDITIVEVELRREAPLHNVAKIIMWASHLFEPKKVMLIQLFDSSHYDKESKLQKTLAVFLGEKATAILSTGISFEYYHMDLDIPRIVYRNCAHHRDEIKQIVAGTFERMCNLGWI
jgi:hypothetical protein